MRLPLPLSLALILAPEASAQNRSQPPPPPPPAPAPPASGGSSLGGGGTPLTPGRVVTVENVSFEIQPAKGKVDECPALVQISDKRDRDLNGGVASFESRGEASLGWFAGPFALVESTDGRAVWRARLKPRFQACVAKARVRSRSGIRVPPERAYLFMTFGEGHVDLVLDVRAYRKDAMVIRREISDQGEPRWSWKPYSMAATP